MFRFCIFLTSQGTAYHGWQIQPNAITVQAELNKALTLIFRQNIDCVGCGRTDAGVHAKNYVAHFDLNNESIDLNLAKYKLNSILPKDIAINNIIQVDNNFHARFNATERTYKYFINQSKDPFRSLFSTYIPYKLDVWAMNEACKYLIGRRNSTCFSKTHTDVNNYYCTINYASWEIIDNQLVFTIIANRFLRNMVRAIVGTLCDVGTGKIEPSQLIKIIELENRKHAGSSVDAKGLFLWNVQY